MQTQTPMNRKSATRLLLVQWSRFQNVSVKLEGSTLFTGINGSGKSTILDAVTYLITGNTQFNKAAKDRDRTVLGYVRGDTNAGYGTVMQVMARISSAGFKNIGLVTLQEQSK